MAARKRRLLFVVNQAAYFASHRLALAEAARAAGWQVAIALPAGPGLEKIQATGLDTLLVPLSRSGLRPDRELASLWALRLRLRAFDPDLVHCVALKAVALGGLAARLSAPRSGRVFAISSLGHVFTDTGLKARLVAAGFRALLPWLAAGRSRIIVQNDADRTALAALPGLSGKLRLIEGAGVDLEAIRPRAAPEGPVKVLLAARLIRKKGVADYAEAGRLLTARGLDMELLVAGAPDPDNPETLTREELTAWQAAGALTWLGPRDDVPDLLGRSHIACLPSYYGEGVPKFLLEAAAAGLPLVTTDTPGCNSIARHEETGLLVPPRDPTALATALARLAEDPALRGRLGQGARQRAVAAFGLEGVIARTLALYEELAP